MEIALPPLLISFLLTLLVTPRVIAFAKNISLVDDPRKHRHPAIIHKKPIPRGGGIALLAGILIPSLLFLPLQPDIVAILAGGSLAVLVGTLDDKFDISPYLRFLSNIAVAAIPVFLGGVKMAFITNPFGGILDFESIGPYVAEGLAIVWIVWTMNMLNWSKGVDGQMPGIAVISALTIGLLSFRFQPLSEVNIMTITLSFITAGAALGFLIFNFYPARIFPGYGATVLGFLLAITSLLGGAKLATAILVMGVPTVDGVFTVVRRIISGRSPFRGDKKHLHHLLLEKGLSQRTIALLYWLFSAILGAVSLSLTSKAKFFAILLLLVLVGGAILWLSSLSSQENSESSNGSKT